MQTIDQILRSVFGYTEFRPLQRQVIEQVLQRRDTLAIMPTGGGKSLCYQIPALIFPGLTVVVSPLIALMKDQVEQLEALGVAALFLNSSLSLDEYNANMQRVRRGEVRLLYVAPETLLTARILQLLQDAPVDCLTIDEAHCISEWGHDFRPEYRQLAGVRRQFPQAVCLALTATATPRVRQDIKASLGFQDSQEFIASFNRPNLFIEVAPKSRAAQQTLAFLRRFPDQSGIIYCFSRKQVDDLAAFLAGQGFSVRPYHAGLEDAARKQNQEQFIRDDVQIIVATIAFGMGINKPNVRFIIHFDLPKSLEGYYQEIGRAGRDGLPAHCLLLYTFADAVKQRHFIEEKTGQERRAAEEQLAAMTRYAESGICRRAPLLAYFGETYTTENCGMCDNCRKTQDQQVDITIPAQKFLSCVKRAGERFGATHITNILLGSQEEKVLRYGHQNLSTYAIGKELTRKQWLLVAQQLVQKGLLEQSGDMYRTLRLTPQAYETLKTRAPILGRLEEPEETQPARRKGEIEYDAALFDLLRQKRKELADAAHVPPYVIFSDRSLVEMAAYYPQSPGSFLEINGVGTRKLQTYGEAFLDVIRAYCQAKGIAEKPPQTGRSAAAAAEREAAALERMLRKPRHVEVGEAYNAGKTIDELAAQYGVQRGTILDHLAKFAGEGQRLRPGEDFLAETGVPAPLRQAALQAFEALGTAYLKPVFEALEGEVSYDDLKILRLHYLSGGK